MAAISTRRRRRPASSASSRWTAAGGLWIPTGTFSFPPVPPAWAAAEATRACRAGRTTSPRCRRWRRTRGRTPPADRLLRLEPGAPARQGTRHEVDGPGAPAPRILGPQHHRQLERFAALGRAQEGLPGEPRRLGHGDGLPGHARRVTPTSSPRSRTSDAAAAMRAAQGRPLAARLLHRQRAALAGPGVARRGHHPRAASPAPSSAKPRRFSPAATPRSGESNSSTAPSTSSWK